MQREELARRKWQLRVFAGQEGFELLDVFEWEPPRGLLDVSRELAMSCRLDGVQDIVVPTLADLHRTEELARFMRDDIAKWINGRVWIADEPRSRTGATSSEAG
jgi:hypothetical protein